MEKILCNTLAKPARRVTKGGREYLVAPLSLIVPGVLNGSKGPLLYPHQQINRNPGDWDGIPLTAYHPVSNDGNQVSAKTPGILEKQGIGYVSNPRANGRLTAEGWFDVEKTQNADKRFGTGIYANLVKGIPIELSTGLFTENVPAPIGATFKGRPYSAVAENYGPDHVAVLYDQVGACSLNDGCGVLINKQTQQAPYGSNPEPWQEQSIVNVTFLNNSGPLYAEKDQFGTRVQGESLTVNPAWVEDHDLWEKAKAAAAKGGNEENYAIVTTIYKNMGGGIKKGKTQNAWTDEARKAAQESLKALAAERSNKAAQATKDVQRGKESHPFAALMHRQASEVHDQVGDKESKRMSKIHSQLAESHERLTPSTNKLDNIGPCPNCGNFMTRDAETGTCTVCHRPWPSIDELSKGIDAIAEKGSRRNTNNGGGGGDGGTTQSSPSVWTQGTKEVPNPSGKRKLNMSKANKIEKRAAKMAKNQPFSTNPITMETTRTGETTTNAWTDEARAAAVASRAAASRSSHSTSREASKSAVEMSKTAGKLKTPEAHENAALEHEAAAKEHNKAVNHQRAYGHNEMAQIHADAAAAHNKAADAHFKERNRLESQTTNADNPYLSALFNTWTDEARAASAEARAAAAGAKVKFNISGGGSGVVKPPKASTAGSSEAITKTQQQSSAINKHGMRSCNNCGAAMVKNNKEGQLQCMACGEMAHNTEKISMWNRLGKFLFGSTESGQEALAQAYLKANLLLENTWTDEARAAAKASREAGASTKANRMSREALRLSLDAEHASRGAGAGGVRSKEAHETAARLQHDAAEAHHAAYKEHMDEGNYKAATHHENAGLGHQKNSEAQSRFAAAYNSIGSGNWSYVKRADHASYLSAMADKADKDINAPARNARECPKCGADQVGPDGKCRACGAMVENAWTDEAREAAEAARAAHSAAMKHTEKAGYGVSKHALKADYASEYGDYKGAATAHTNLAKVHDRLGNGEAASAHRDAASAFKKVASLTSNANDESDQGAEDVDESAADGEGYDGFDMSDSTHSQLHEAARKAHTIAAAAHEKAAQEAANPSATGGGLDFSKPGMHYAKSAYHKEMANQHSSALGNNMLEPRRSTHNQAFLHEVWMAYNRDWPQEKRDQLDAKDFAGPNQSFPIKTQEDLDAAIHSIGRAKDPDTIKAGIRRIAKRKGLSLPDTETWETNEGDDRGGTLPEIGSISGMTGPPPVGNGGKSSVKNKRALNLSAKARKLTRNAARLNSKALSTKHAERICRKISDLLNNSTKAARIHAKVANYHRKLFTEINDEILTQNSVGNQYDSRQVKLIHNLQQSVEMHKRAAWAHEQAAKLMCKQQVALTDNNDRDNPEKGTDMARLSSKERGKIISYLTTNCNCGPNANAWSGDDADLLQTFSDSRLKALAEQQRTFVKNAKDDDDDDDDDSSSYDSSADSSMPARSKERNAGEEIHSFDLSHPVAGGVQQAGGKGTKDEYEEIGYKSKTSLGKTTNSDADMERWIRNSDAPESIKDAVKYARDQERKYKIGLVTKIIQNVMDDNKRNLIGNNLMKKPRAELEEMVSLMPPAPAMVQHRQDRPIYFGGAVPEGGTVVNSLAEDDRKNTLPLPTLDYKEIAAENSTNKRGK
jgi:hypothetical protein